MWLAMNDALLANHAWFRRGLVHVDTCALCVIYSKTMLHVLHDYDKVMELWKSVRNSLIKSSLFQQSPLITGWKKIFLMKLKLVRKLTSL